MAHSTAPRLDNITAAKTAESTTLAGVALLLGACIILSAGFAPIGAIHGAAHDSRHALALPCH